MTKKSRATAPKPGVAPESRTETFVALKLNIDNWRWAGVPFYLRTGKRLAKRHTEIAIQFKRMPFELFRNAPFHKLHTNTLVIQIQPVEGISLSFGAKIPGPVLRVGSVDMSFEYSKYFGADAYTGYEVLLYDCMIGDATLVPARRHGGGRMERRRSGPGRLASLASAQVSQLRVRHLGTGGVGSTAATR